jgi:glycosyltransferase involved in cell wall biosynthesis
MFVYNNFKNDARVLKEAKSLVAAGYSVTVVALLDKTTKAYEEKDGIRIIRVAINPLHRRILSSWRSSVESFKETSIGQAIKPIWKSLRTEQTGSVELRQENTQENGKLLAVARPVEHHQPKKTNTKTPIKQRIKSEILFLYSFLSFVDFYDKAFKAIANEPADIYHGHDLTALPVAYQAAQRHHAKFVYDSHELFLERNTRQPITQTEQSLWRVLEGYLIRRASAVITVNEPIAKELAQRYQIETPTVIMNAPFQKGSIFDDKDRNLRTILEVSNDYHLLLYSGTRTFNRGLEKLIQSLIYLPKCHLVLLGMGSAQYNEKLQTLTHEVGVQSRVSFFGPVPSEEVTAYAASVDLGIVANENVCLNNYYSSPNKLFEYIIAGLPVAASDFPVMKKVIEQFEIGCTFDPSSPQNIAQAVLHMLEDSEKLQRMKQNTFIAAQVYNWENESKKLIELYSQL